MAFRHVISDTGGKTRFNAGKIYSQNTSVNTDNNAPIQISKLRANAGKAYGQITTITADFNSPLVVKLRTNTGKAYDSNTPQVIEVSRQFEPMRLGGKRRSTGTTAASVADSFFSVKTVYASAGSPIQSFTNDGILLKDTVMPSQLTFCAWVKTSLTTRGQIVLSNSTYYATSVASFPFQFWITSAGGYYVTLDAGGNFSSDFSYSSSGLGLNDGNWHHLGCIYRANNDFRVYIDGVLVDTRTHAVTCNNPSLAWAIGTFAQYNAQSPTDNAFNGSLAYPIFAPTINDSSIITNAFTVKPF